MNIDVKKQKKPVLRQDKILVDILSKLRAPNDSGKIFFSNYNQHN